MPDTTSILVETIKSYLPTANFDTTTEAGYVRCGYNIANVTDKAVLTDIFEHAATKAGWAFDGYDENGAACFIL